MHCDQAQQEMMNRKSHSFEPDAFPEFEAHLESCGDCRGFYQTIVLMEQSAKAWTDEEVPAWDRRIGIGPSRERLRFLQWAPLAACLLLTLLFVFKVEVHKDASGWEVRFGGSNQAQEAALASLLEQERAKNSAALKRLLEDYNLRQSKNLALATAQLTTQLRAEQTADLRRVIEGYTTQRDKDMEWVQARFENLLFNQQRTHDNLNQIANYVTREAARP